MFSPRSMLLAILLSSSSIVQTQKLSVGYYPAWAIYARDFQVSQIPGSFYTNIIYAFANISESNEIQIMDTQADLGGASPDDETYGGNYKKLQELKQTYPHLKISIAVGGFSGSNMFSATAASRLKRRKFVRSVGKFVQKYCFDGVDIDWEYPVEGGDASVPHQPEDKENYTKLIKDLRKELDLLSGERRVLSAALPALPSTAMNFELEKISAVVDFVGLMEYDFMGSWSSVTGHQANIYPDKSVPTELSISQSLDFYKQYVPLNKIVLGYPMYGRGWAGVADTRSTMGLGQKFNSIPDGTWEVGVFDYKAIKASIEKGELETVYSELVGASWAIDHSKQIVISYDDVNVVKQKARLVREMNLAGTMTWEISADYGGEMADASYKELNKDDDYYQISDVHDI